MQENISETVVKAFLNVHHDSLTKLCLDLELITEDETMNVESWFPLWRKALGRVAERNLHSQLWDELAKAGVVHGDNPYEIAVLVSELEFNLSRGFQSRKQIEADSRRHLAGAADNRSSTARPSNVDRERELQADRVAAYLGMSADELDAFRDKPTTSEVEQLAVDACEVLVVSPGFTGPSWTSGASA